MNNTEEVKGIHAFFDVIGVFQVGHLAVLGRNFGNLSANSIRPGRGTLLISG